MHPQSLNAVTHFMMTFMDPAKPSKILDVGSQDINGTYRPLFKNPDWSYTGMDQEAGKNVDLVVKDPYNWPEVPADEYDVVVSGQMFEHCPQFWRVGQEIKRVLKPGGMLCVVVPAAFGHEHRYPIDCYRFLPDGLRAIADYAGLSTIVADYVHRWHTPIQCDYWIDTILIARKPFA